MQYGKLLFSLAMTSTLIAFSHNVNAAYSQTSKVITGNTLYVSPGVPASSTDAQTVTACMGEAVFFGGEGGITATIYRNSESEPHLVVNPTNPNNIVVAHHIDRMSKSGGAVGLGIVYTFDGGKTWTKTKVPSTRCGGGGDGTGMGGDFERDTDPYLAFSPDGKALYLASIPFNISENYSETFAVTKSLDSGKTWQKTKTISFDPTFGLRNVYDWEKLLIVPSNKSAVGYVMFFLGQNYAYKGSSRDNFPFEDSNGNKKNQMVLSRSFDGGNTWDPFRVIYDWPVSKIQNPVMTWIPASPAQPDGIVEIGIYFNQNALNTYPSKSNKDKILLMSSYNLGQTWTPPVAIQDIVGNTNLTNGGPADPDNGIFFSGSSINMIADPKTGYLYVSWLDARYDLPTGISPLISMSKDKGLTWTTPIKISPNIAKGAQASGPNGLAVADDGTVAVTFYDFRRDVLGDATWDTDLYVSFLKPTTNSLSYIQELRITDTPMDSRQFVTRTTISSGYGGYFPGDYFGLANIGNDFVAVNTIANQNGTVPVNPPNTTELLIDSVNHQNILFTRITKN